MKKQHVQLSEEDKKYLEGLLSKGSLAAKMYKRVVGLLELNKGKTYQAVMPIIHISYPTIISWTKKYKTSGLSFLKDKNRSGRPPEILGEQKAKITALACSKSPTGRSQWSLRLLADKVVELKLIDSISHTEVGRILKKTNYNHTEKDNGV